MKDIPPKNSSRRKKLSKVFKIAVTQCQYYKGEVAFVAPITVSAITVAALTVAAITNRSEVANYLGHIGIEHESRARAPTRYQLECF